MCLISWIHPRGSKTSITYRSITFKTVTQLLSGIQKLLAVQPTDLNREHATQLLLLRNCPSA
jgi:hypothetical protein